MERPGTITIICFLLFLGATYLLVKDAREHDAEEAHLIELIRQCQGQRWVESMQPDRKFDAKLHQVPWDRDGLLIQHEEPVINLVEDEGEIDMVGRWQAWDRQDLAKRQDESAVIETSSPFKAEKESNDSAIPDVTASPRSTDLHGFHSPADPASITREPDVRVKEAMIHAWRSYVRLMLRRGTDHPGPLAVAVVESLDTLYIMGLHDEFTEATEWVASNLNIKTSHFEVGASVTYTTTRVIGGLLSAYDLSGRTEFLTKAQELAEWLLPGWNRRRGSTGRYAYSQDPEEADFDLSGYMEFVALYLRTGNLKYIKRVTKDLKTLEGDGLLPICTGRGKTACRESNSYFYAHLLKIPMLSSERPCMWEHYMEGLLSLVTQSSTSGYKYVAWRHTITHKMDELTCYVPGMLALGADRASPARATQYLETAEELAKTCYLYFSGKSHHVFQENDNNLTRGQDVILEFVSEPVMTKSIESFFYLWRKTSDPKYRDWAWEIFQTGYSDSSSASENYPLMDSFFLPNTLKYLYMLYAPSSVMPLDAWVFNTEGHPVQIRDTDLRDGYQWETACTALDIAADDVNENSHADRFEKSALDIAADDVHDNSLADKFEKSPLTKE